MISCTLNQYSKNSNVSKAHNWVPLFENSKVLADANIPEETKKQVQTTKEVYSAMADYMRVTNATASSIRADIENAK